MIWYHGDTSKRSKFSDQKMDRDQHMDPNAMGPGIYWTESKRQAKGYAYPKGYIYTAEIRTNKVIKDETKPNRAKVKSLIELAPDLDMALSNFGYDPGYTSKSAVLKDAIDGYMNFSESMIDAALTIYHDFYNRTRANLWAMNMVKVGIDAFEHKLRELKHLIVYNPKVIKVKKIEAYSEVVDESIELMLSGLPANEVVDRLI